MHWRYCSLALSHRSRGCSLWNSSLAGICSGWGITAVTASNQRLLPWQSGKSVIKSSNYQGIYCCHKFDGLVQDCSNSNALAMELLQFCTKPSTWCYYFYCISVMEIISYNFPGEHDRAAVSLNSEQMFAPCPTGDSSINHFCSLLIYMACWLSQVKGQMCVGVTCPGVLYSCEVVTVSATHHV